MNKINSLFQGSSDGNGFTTTPLNISGANGIILGISTYSGDSAATISDSKSNSYGTAIFTQTNGGIRLQVFAFSSSDSSKFDSAHTWTIGGGCYGPSIAVIAYSGANPASFVDQSVYNTANATSCASGSITPTNNNSAVVTFAVAGDTFSSVSSGFTPAEGTVDSTGNHQAIGAAFKIQTTKQAENPTWDLGFSTNWVVGAVTLNASTSPTASLTETTYTQDSGTTDYSSGPSKVRETVLAVVGLAVLVSDIVYCTENQNPNIATRFYLEYNVTSPIDTDQKGFYWDYQNSGGTGFQTYKANIGGSTQGSTLTSRTHQNNAATSAQTGVTLRFVTEPLKKQTISGTVRGQIQCSTSTPSSLASVALCITLVDSLGRYKSELLDTTADVTGGSLIAITRTNRRFRDASGNADIAITSTPVNHGDRLVFEIGVREAYGSGLEFFYVGTSAASGDLPTEDTDTATDKRPWIEFSQNLQFASPISDTIYSRESQTAVARGSSTDNIYVRENVSVAFASPVRFVIEQITIANPGFTDLNSLVNKVREFVQAVLAAGTSIQYNGGEPAYVRESVSTLLNPLRRSVSDDIYVRDSLAGLRTIVYDTISTYNEVGQDGPMGVREFIQTLLVRPGGSPSPISTERDENNTVSEYVYGQLNKIRAFIIETTYIRESAPGTSFQRIIENSTVSESVTARLNQIHVVVFDTVYTREASTPHRSPGPAGISPGAENCVVRESVTTKFNKMRLTVYDNVTVDNVKSVTPIGGTARGPESRNRNRYRGRRG